ncbi:MAG: tRNA (adenosine(37)-N6)-dimethylallyltransferase MiaA [Anaerovoracaceae bacterium]
MNKIVAVAGPTAVGKTKFAIEIAKKFNGEIVSCDSMQLYKYMDIGSAKPTEEEIAQVKHHLIDFIDPRDDFSVAQYQSLAKKAIKDILNREKLPVISGGTGLYLNSIIYEMDFSRSCRDIDYRKELEHIAAQQGSQALHNMLERADKEASLSIHPNNTKKIIRALERIHQGEGKIKAFKDIKQETRDYDTVIIGLTRNRQELYERINQRVDVLMQTGLLDEVKALLDKGLTPEHISMKAIGYKEIMDYFLGKYDLETAVDKVKKNTRHYAKKQLTWFRRYDKIKWYNISDFNDDEDALESIVKWLEKKI